MNEIKINQAIAGQTNQPSPVGRGGNTKAAFTLAEVLITLGIIGVVAALTIPMFMENVNNRIKAKRMENIHQKLSKVTDKMASLDVLQGHVSTHDFVYEMKKHMNIAKICENKDIAGCWPTSSVNIGKDEDYAWDISKTTRPKDLKITVKDGQDWDNPMAIITGDGTSMIISYNKNCSFSINDGLHYNDDTATSNSLTSGCFAIIYDWNGSSKPNKLGDDVQILGEAGGLGHTCAIEIDNLCITKKAHVPTPMSKSDCEEAVLEDKLGIEYCNYDKDYWAGAVKECGGIKNMPSQSDLEQIASYIFGKKMTGYAFGSFNDDSLKRIAELGVNYKGKAFYFWGDKENGSDSAYGRGMRDGETSYVTYKRDSNAHLVLCKGD